MVQKCTPENGAFLENPLKSADKLVIDLRDIICDSVRGPAMQIGVLIPGARGTRSLDPRRERRLWTLVPKPWGPTDIMANWITPGYCTEAEV